MLCIVAFINSSNHIYFVLHGKYGKYTVTCIVRNRIKLHSAGRKLQLTAIGNYYT